MTLAHRPSPVGELLSLRQAMDRRIEDGFVRPRQISITPSTSHGSHDEAAVDSIAGTGDKA
jgi:hypothetical protein